MFIYTCIYLYLYMCLYIKDYTYILLSCSEYVCYRTNVAMASGFTLCRPQFVRQRPISVADETDSYKILYLHSPGRLKGRDYSNRLATQLVALHASCKISGVGARIATATPSSCLVQSKYDLFFKICTSLACDYCA